MKHLSENNLHIAKRAISVALYITAMLWLTFDVSRDNMTPVVLLVSSTMGAPPMKSEGRWRVNVIRFELIALLVVCVPLLKKLFEVDLTVFALIAIFITCVIFPASDD